MQYCEVDGITSAPERDDVAKTEEDDTDDVCPLGTLRPVAERTDEDDEQEAEVELEEDFEDVSTCSLGKELEGIGFGVRSSRGDQEEERKVEVGEGGPGEQKLDGVVDELELKDDLAEEALPGRPYAEPEDGGVDGSEQGSVQPTTTLRDELGYCGGHIGRRFCALDVLQSAIGR